MFTPARSIGLTLVAAVAALPSAGEAQTLKEGVATFITRSSRGKADTVVQYTKGRDLRLEGLGGRNEGTFIVDGDGKRLIVLDAGDRKAMVMSEDDAKQMEEMAAAMGVDPSKISGAEGRKEKPSITKTGRTETVAGVRCEVYHVAATRKGDTEEGDACLADGIGFGIMDAFANMPMARNATQEFDRYRSIVGPGKGIVKATTVRDGKTVTVLELLRFDARTVPASQFEVPRGYETQDMGDMMGQARGAIERLKKKKP
jgi:hypothetical protein